VPSGSKDDVVAGEDRLLTVLEAAHFLNIAPGSLYHLISQRRIPVIRLSARCVRFSRPALMEWVASLSQAADHQH
jgi:excisionase family DNA binding protein